MSSQENNKIYTGEFACNAKGEVSIYQGLERSYRNTLIRNLLNYADEGVFDKELNDRIIKQIENDTLEVALDTPDSDCPDKHYNLFVDRGTREIICRQEIKKTNENLFEKFKLISLESGGDCTGLFTKAEPEEETLNME